MAVLKTPEFVLEIEYNKNCALTDIKGLDYSGRFGIYCSNEEYRSFVLKIISLYETLNEDEARLQQCYEHDFISVKSDGLGHFEISGEFNNWLKWNLRFMETVDQTYLKDFVKQLNNEVNK